MVEIKNLQVVGLERSLVSAANSFSSGEINTTISPIERDFDRGRMLGGCNTGEGHDSFLKGIVVYMDIKYPQYWTPQMQRYNWMEIMSSQSKMHCLCKNAKDKDEFSKMFNKYVDEDIITKVEEYANKYNTTDKKDTKSKYYWFMKTLSNLPSGYELWMTVKTSYLQLKTIYQQRRKHPLKEDWREGFCKKIEELPMFMELCGFNKSKDYATALNKLHSEVTSDRQGEFILSKEEVRTLIEGLAIETFNLEKSFVKKVQKLLGEEVAADLMKKLWKPIINELERFENVEIDSYYFKYSNYVKQMKENYGEENKDLWDKFYIDPFSRDLFSLNKLGITL